MTDQFGVFNQRVAISGGAFKRFLLLEAVDRVRASLVSRPTKPAVWDSPNSVTSWNELKHPVVEAVHNVKVAPSVHVHAVRLVQLDFVCGAAYAG